MRILVVTPPDPVISLEEAKVHLRVWHDDEDTLIEQLIAAATAHIDGPEGYLGRAVGVQVLESRFDCFDANGMMLPLPPVIELESVQYLDRDNVAQSLDLSICELFDRELVPAYGKRWPSALAREEAVRVRYRAGYETLPAPIRAAVLLMVGDLYAFRETAVTGTISTKVEMSTTVENLLFPYRIWS